MDDVRDLLRGQRGAFRFSPGGNLDALAGRRIGGNEFILEGGGHDVVEHYQHGMHSTLSCC